MHRVETKKSSSEQGSAMMCLVTSVADGRILNASLRHVVFQTACSWQGGADVVRMKLWLAQRQTAKVLSEHVVLVFRFRMFSRGPLATSGGAAN